MYQFRYDNDNDLTTILSKYERYRVPSVPTVRYYDGDTCCETIKSSVYCVCSRQRTDFNFSKLCCCLLNQHFDVILVTFDFPCEEKPV